MSSGGDSIGVAHLDLPGFALARELAVSAPRTTCARRKNLMLVCCFFLTFPAFMQLSADPIHPSAVEVAGERCPRRAGNV